MMLKNQSTPPQEYLFCVGTLSIQTSPFLFYRVVVRCLPTHLCDLPKLLRGINYFQHVVFLTHESGEDLKRIVSQLVCLCDYIQGMRAQCAELNGKLSWGAGQLRGRVH